MSNSSLAQQIVDTITANRISTTEVADALGKRGVLRGVGAMTENLHRVGIVRPVFTAHDSNYAVHDQIRDIQPGEVCVIYAHACDDRAIIGDLVSKFVTLYRRASAIVVNGMVRDAARIRRERYPVWSTGVTPLGCWNTPASPYPADEAARIHDEVAGGIAVCDDGGVVVIPRAEVTEATLDRLHRIELQEDLWYFCLDVLKWDTKRIVCDKAYLTEPGVLPQAYAEQLQQLREALDRGRPS
jgi:regulator of RNase E activity RraA